MPVTDASIYQIRVQGQLDASVLAPWTGTVRVTDHLGTYRILGAGGGATVELLLGQEPAFVTSEP